ncbi:hypothetical protein CCR75_004195 [Bremia lactucae]|uniref:Periodic tryptophan protein 1 n=1 Tax=Bremia lactucae TaxID=4779 RepID=A0A976IDS7_BRELC|nr:hypothetical protein CCR75_004195 [Bremia lactucae]
MISALAWVPRGASRRIPEKLKLTDEELRMLHEAAVEEEAEDQSGMATEDVYKLESPLDHHLDSQDGLPASFKMDEYEEEDDNAAIQNFYGGDATEAAEEEEEVETDQPDEDGNISMDDDDDRDDEFDREDVEVRPTDSVILVANTEEDFSTLEVQVYDDENGALYVHHEINLPAFPLCLAWMDCAPVPLNPVTGPLDGSYVAVGTFKPGIEIWNLDILDVLEPTATLGGEDDRGLRNVAVPGPTTSLKRNSKLVLKKASHQDAVMSLDWNRNHRNMLVSGSADATVKVWDVTTQKCLYTITHHCHKVQSVRWNPIETSVVASASFDRTIVVLDGRQPDAFSTFSLTAEVESIAWAPHCPSTIVAASEDGMVVAYDVRMNHSEPLFRLEAHHGAVSAISFSAQVPGLFATAGVDKCVKLWDVMENVPKCVASKEMNVGELFALSFDTDSPFLLGVGGSKGVLALWDTLEKKEIDDRFGARVQGFATTVSKDIASSFQTPFQRGEELATEEERVNSVRSKKKTSHSKKGKKQFK